jgi:hypothetical protein
MRPKGKLFALVVLFAAVGLLTATGAFTTVEADRTATVNAAGDASALIAIQPADENGQYVDNSSDEIEFDISEGSNSGATGVNLNATTDINRTMNITNNGQESVNLYLEASGGNASLVSFHNSTKDNITGEDNKMSVGSGDNATISVVIDTKENQDLGADDEIINTITIVAESESS